MNIILFLFLAVLILSEKKRIKDSTFKFIVLFIVIFDIYKFNLHYPTVTNYDILTENTESSEFFKQTSSNDYFRVYSVNNYLPSSKRLGFLFEKGAYTNGSIKRYKELYFSHLSSLFRVYGAGGADSIQSLPIFKILPLIDVDPLKYKFLIDLLNIKYLLSLDEYENIHKFNLKRIGRVEGRIHIYENLSYLPRLFVSRKARFIQDDQEILRQLLSPNNNLTEEVIIKGNADYEKGQKNLSNVETSEDRIDMVKYSANRIKIKAFLKSTGYLVLLDTFYPGWKVNVNGNNAEILQANLLFRAVKLNAGNNDIEFFFRPIPFSIGGIISSVALFILIMIIIVLKKYNR